MKRDRIYGEKNKGKAGKFVGLECFSLVLPAFGFGCGTKIAPVWLWCVCVRVSLWVSGSVFHLGRDDL